VKVDKHCLTIGYGLLTVCLNKRLL
jgi:hypothetical protein